MQEIEILRVVVQTQHGLDSSCPDSQPWLPFVLGVSPIERGMPRSDAAKISIVNLSTDSQLIGHLHRGICAELSEFAAAEMAGVHRQPVVVTGMDKSLRGKSVDLYVPVKHLEILPAKQALTGTKKHKYPARNSMHGTPHLSRW